MTHYVQKGLVVSTAGVNRVGKIQWCGLFTNSLKREWITKLAQDRNLHELDLDEENLDGFNKGSQKTIGIQGQIITKFDSIIYDPWYYKNFFLVSCPDLGEKIA